MRYWFFVSTHIYSFVNRPNLFLLRLWFPRRLGVTRSLRISHIFPFLLVVLWRVVRTPISRFFQRYFPSIFVQQKNVTNLLLFFWGQKISRIRTFSFLDLPTYILLRPLDFLFKLLDSTKTKDKTSFLARQNSN